MTTRLAVREKSLPTGVPAWQARVPFVGPRLAGFRLEVPLVADACKVSASTPNVEFWLAALLGWRDPRPVKKAPPVACGAQNYAKETCLHTRAFRLRILGAGTTPRVQPHGYNHHG
jgi:hypothetical protein